MHQPVAPLPRQPSQPPPASSGIFRMARRLRRNRRNPSSSFLQGISSPPPPNSRAGARSPSIESSPSPCHRHPSPRRHPPTLIMPPFVNVWQKTVRNNPKRTCFFSVPPFTVPKMLRHDHSSTTGRRQRRGDCLLVFRRLHPDFRHSLLLGFRGHGSQSSHDVEQ